MTPYEQIIEAIIGKQVLVLGQHIALLRARRVHGLLVEDDGGGVKLSGEPLHAIEQLIVEYREILGPAADLFSRDAALPIIEAHPDLLVPLTLKQ